MDSLTFTPGRAFLSSDSPAVPWTVVFEDEGVAGYFYACDRSQTKHEDSILDAMLIYNVASMSEPDTQPAGRMVTVQWSRAGLKAALYLDGTPQALYDFGERCGYCRLNFPNFLSDRADNWRRNSHAWSDAAMQEFEAALYA